MTRKKGFIYEAVSSQAPLLLQFSEVYRSILGWVKEAVAGNLSKFSIDSWFKANITWLSLSEYRKAKTEKDVQYQIKDKEG